MKTVRLKPTLTLLIAILCHAVAVAQEFNVQSFRELTNDVSAFIAPVRDNNGEDCALVKVMAPEEFVFSTPLGIVKREDKTGEIWLYIPSRTKKITVKHPEWGVLRDYIFPVKIVGHFAYEMTLDYPRRESGEVREIITHVTDTVMVTRIDTLTVERRPTPRPLRISAIATFGFGTRNHTPSAGLLLMAQKSIGGFLHVISNLTPLPSTVGDCQRDGEFEDRMPFYTGRAKRGLLIANIGATHSLSDGITLFEGFGYGNSSLCWQLAPSEGGGYLSNSYYSARGISFEAGIIVHRGPIQFSASAISIQGREWIASVGIGFQLCSVKSKKNDHED